MSNKMRQTRQSEHLPKPERENYLTFGLKFIPLLETILLMFALYQLGFSKDGVVGWLKLGIFGIAAYLVSYLIYRMAIEKGATLNSVGYKRAGVLSGLSVLLVGVAFFIATAAGLTISSVEEHRLAAFINAQEAYVDAKNNQVAGSLRLAPVINSIADDLEAKADCEIRVSCVSGRGSGGFGSTSRMLQTLSARARGIADQISVGLDKRAKLQEQLSLLMTHMNETIADEAREVWIRRAKLRKHDGELSRLLNRLDEAVPTSLVTSYAQELRSGITIPNRPEVSKTINRFLSGYAGSIESTLAKTPIISYERPKFPSKTGALETFEFIGKFAPIFLLAFLIDVMFPLALWSYTVMGLDWMRFQSNPDDRRGKRHRSDFDDLTELRAVQLRDNSDQKLPDDNAAIDGSNNTPPKPSPSHHIIPRKPRR